MSTFPPTSLLPVTQEVATLLKEKKETIAVAETAAGGLTSAVLLSVSGASRFYKGGLTLYTLPSRIAYAGWTESHVANYTGPTPSIVAGLAESTRKRLIEADKSVGKGEGPTWVVAESGTAGPAGSGEGRNRQPGYVALAVAGPNGTVTREVETGTNDRAENMIKFAEGALSLVRDVLKGHAKL